MSFLAADADRLKFLSTWRAKPPHGLACKLSQAFRAFRHVRLGLGIEEKDCDHIAVNNRISYFARLCLAGFSNFHGMILTLQKPTNFLPAYPPPNQGHVAGARLRLHWRS